MTFTEAAAQVLRLVGKPLHYKEITDVAIERNLLSHVGKSPEVTMGARLAALVKKGEKDNPLVRVKPGVFALREWDSTTIEKGLQDRTPALERLAAQHPSEADDAEPDQTSGAVVAEAEEGEEAPPRVLDEAERERAELAAHATDFFASEEDDDEPIFGRDSAEPAAAAAGGDVAGDRGPGGGRRRRRRRRGRGAGDEPRGGGDGLPSYTVSDAPADLAPLGVDLEVRAPVERVERIAVEARAPLEPRVHVEARSYDGRSPSEPRHADRYAESRHPDSRDRSGHSDRGGYADRERERERDRSERVNGEAAGGVPFEELAGTGLAEGLIGLLGTFDRNRGPVALQTLVDAAQRRGRFFGEHSVGQGLLVAAARADNARSLSRGERPRFRLSNGRIGLTDWSLDPELVRIEREVREMAERHREASRRAVLRVLQDLPHRALGELVVLLLEHVGFVDLVPVRRPGAHGAELHLAGKLQTPAGEIRTAVVVRRDGREIGRERVTELRGALHHYGPAHAAWLITTGQALSGAREEAASPGASPLTVIDGLGLVKLCEEHAVGVLRAQVPLLLPDLDLLDGLRAS